MRETPTENDNDDDGQGNNENDWCDKGNRKVNELYGGEIL